MKHSTLALPIIAVAALGLAGCASPAVEPEPSTASGPLAVNIIASPHAEAVVAAFEETHPDIDVELTTTTLSFEDGSVQTHLRSGAGADVLLLNSGPGRIGLIAEAGLVLDVSDLYADGIDASYPDDVLSQITYDDAIYEIAEGRDIFQLHVNAALFEDAGVDVPTSWDELLDVCEPLADSGVRPLAVGARDNYAGGWLLGTLVQSAVGVEPVRDVLFGDASIAASGPVEGGQHLADLIEAGCIDGTEGLALEFEQALSELRPRPGGDDRRHPGDHSQSDRRRLRRRRHPGHPDAVGRRRERDPDLRARAELGDQRGDEERAGRRRVDALGSQ